MRTLQTVTSMFLLSKCSVPMMVANYSSRQQSQLTSTDKLRWTIWTWLWNNNSTQSEIHKNIENSKYKRKKIRKIQKNHKISKIKKKHKIINSKKNHKIIKHKKISRSCWNCMMIWLWCLSADVLQSSYCWTWLGSYIISCLCVD